MGKTTLIQNMIVADMRAGRGICLIDPHGDHYCASMLRSENSRRRMSGVVNWELLAKSEVTPESRDWTPERAEQAIREAAKRLPELCDRLELVTRAEPIHRVASPETTGTKANVMFPAQGYPANRNPEALNDAAIGRTADRLIEQLTHIQRTHGELWGIIVTEALNSPWCDPPIPKAKPAHFKFSTFGCLKTCHVWTKNSPHTDAMNDFGRDASGAQARVDGTAVSVESAGRRKGNPPSVAN